VVRFLSAVAAVIDRKLLMAPVWEVVSRIFASWNQLDGWLRRIDGLRRAV
jgi:hypothetical protein